MSENSFTDHYLDPQLRHPGQTTLEDYEIDIDGPQDDALARFRGLAQACGLPDADIARAEAMIQPTLDALGGAPVRYDNAMLHLVTGQVLQMHHAKEGTYGNSWCRRGELGIFFNIARKFDRLENMVVHDRADEVGESRIDTIADLATYSLLWLTLIMREHPEAYRTWQDSNTKGTDAE